MQQGVPRTGRALPGMPLEMGDPDGEDLPRSKWGRATASNGRWWWPESTVGRVFLALGALIVIVAVTAAIDLSKTYLERDSRFRIAGASYIQATGLTEVSRAQMLPVFGEDIGRNIFFVPIAERRKQLEAIPWIQKATVMRLLPDQIRVDVIERKPVAFTRHGQQIGLVDANGVLLDMGASTMAAHHYSFPVVTGIDPGDKPASRQGRMALYGRLMSELDANNQHYSEQVSEIDLTDPEDARVLMPEQGADILAHFGEDHFFERYQRYKQHIAEWRQQYPKLAAVDLRYGHQVVLEMASGASAAQPTGDAEGAKPAGDVSAQPKSSASPAASKPAASKPAAKAALAKSAKGKSTSKPSNSSSAKSKSSASRTKADQNKKHTPSKTAVQNKKKKPSPAARRTAAEGE
jgi:cell division protein FtsQ